MALQYHRPRKQYLFLGGGQVVAEDVVHVPEQEAGQEHEDALPTGSCVSGTYFDKTPGRPERDGTNQSVTACTCRACSDHTRRVFVGSASAADVFP